MEFVFESDNIQNSSQKMDLMPPSSDDFLSPKQSTRARKSSRRTLPESFSDIQFNEPPKRKRKRTTGPKVNYVKPLKRKKKKSFKKFEWSWGKIGWVFCGVLVLRLFFMESGVFDYRSMNQTLDQKTRELELLRIENAELLSEINLIKKSQSYQKKLAREHLGVIAKDEYLVIFAQDSSQSSYYP